MKTIAVLLAIACNMNALNHDERARYSILTQKLAHAVTAKSELPSGYAFTLDRKKMPVAEVGEWVSLESRCCPFLDFTVEVPANSERLTIRLTGGPGVKDFIRHEFGAGL